MTHLQKWFERMAGIAQEERARREFAQRFFARSPFDASALSTPACWRRKAAQGVMAASR